MKVLSREEMVTMGNSPRSLSNTHGLLVSEQSLKLQRELIRISLKTHQELSNVSSLYHSLTLCMDQNADRAEIILRWWCGFPKKYLSLSLPGCCFYFPKTLSFLSFYTPQTCIKAEREMGEREYLICSQRNRKGSKRNSEALLQIIMCAEKPRERLWLQWQTHGGGSGGWGGQYHI